MLFALASVPLVAPCREENNHHNNAATEVETIAIGKFKEKCIQMFTLHIAGVAVLLLRFLFRCCSGVFMHFLPAALHY